MKALIIFGSAVCFVVVACNKSDADQTTTTTTTGASTRDDNETTIDRITDARCAREIACNNVGANRKWSDIAACRRDIRQSVHGDYRASECQVVLADKLRSCIDGIRDEKCDAVFDMTRINACRKGVICKE